MSVYFWRESEVKDLVQKNGLNVNARNIHNRTALASVLDILLTPENNLTPEQVNWYSNFALLLVLLQSSVDSLDDVCQARILPGLILLSDMALC